MYLAMRKKIYILLSMVASILTSCGSNEDEPEKIVVMLDLKGSQSPIGKEAMNGFLLGWQQMDAEFSSKFYVSIIDTRTDMGVTENAAKETAPVVAVGAGFTDNNSILVAGEYFEEQKVPFISLGATDPTLPARFGNYIFLVPFGDNTQAAAAAEFAVKKFGKSAAVIWDSTSEYTRSLPKYFSTRFEQLGGKILYDTSYPGGCKINQIADNLSMLDPKPDFIYLAALPECIDSIISSLRDHGPELPVIGGDGLDVPAMTQDESISNIWFTAHEWEESERSKKFHNEYKLAFNSLPSSSFAALGYDTARMLGEVLQRSHAENVIDVLEDTVNFEGVTGTISFSKDTHVPKKTVWIIQIDQGKKSLAASFIPKKIPPPDER